MEFGQSVCLIIYSFVVSVLSIYGLHRFILLKLFYRHGRETSAIPPYNYETYPSVLVQLPLYNEEAVAKRLITSVARLNYPREKLTIQVLDDSTDQTREYAKTYCVHLKKKGHNIQYLHRENRAGFKAGALAAGLERSRSEFVLILDADFLPPRNFLTQIIHQFTDQEVGMVQARWGHLNRNHSLLTRIQSIFLDGHFVIEHTARSRSGRFFNFNGTAGIWRRKAIIQAGGWQNDTLTEDLDLSYRAQLAGWRFIYLPEIEVPGEIPIEINGFKSQQQRWTKGAAQVAKKILPRIWQSKIQQKIKIEATLHLTANLCYPLMLFMALLILPMINIRAHLGWSRLLIIDLPLFCFSLTALSSYYLASQQKLYGNWPKHIKLIPLLMAVGMGLCVNNTIAVFEGWLGNQTPFIRTPKYGVTKDNTKAIIPIVKTSSFTIIPLIELALACYFAYAIYEAWRTELYLGVPFLILFFAGFLYIGMLSSRHIFSEIKCFVTKKIARLQ